MSDGTRQSSHPIVWELFLMARFMQIYYTTKVVNQNIPIYHPVGGYIGIPGYHKKKLINL